MNAKAPWFGPDVASAQHPQPALLPVVDGGRASSCALPRKSRRADTNNNSCDTGILESTLQSSRLQVVGGGSYALKWTANARSDLGSLCVEVRWHNFGGDERGTRAPKRQEKTKTPEQRTSPDSLPVPLHVAAKTAGDKIKYDRGRLSSPTHGLALARNDVAVGSVDPESRWAGQGYKCGGATVERTKRRSRSKVKGARANIKVKAKDDGGSVPGPVCWRMQQAGWSRRRKWRWAWGACDV